MIKSLIIAISMYSKIPVPQFEWKERELRYVLCFFSFIGVIIGLVEWGWYVLCNHLQIGEAAYSAVGTAIPILITGGFHIDGYMDTMDAIHSYQPRERKLEILKDSHIGAFAVIMLVCYILLYVAGYSMLVDERCFALFCSTFVVSRILSGLSLMTFPKAKTEGMLATFADAAHKKVVVLGLALELLVTMVFMLWCDVDVGIIAIAAAGVAFLYYNVFSRKHFGGITGDVAGYFVTVCELIMLIGIVIGESIFRR